LRERCGDGVITGREVPASQGLRATLTNPQTQELTPSLEIPEPGATITGNAETWNAILPETERASHAFVALFRSHPDYPADVLYALLAVRLANGPMVDGAVLIFTSEGG
jgi:hypothetical protein